MDKNTLQKYLFEEAEIVQDIVSRMATNQFYIKGWAITLVVASLLLKGDIHHCFVAFIPWFIFWVYDSYFLRLEKLYRTHYTWLIENRTENDESLLDVDRGRLEDRLKKRLKEKFRRKVPCITQIMFSKAILPFYLFLLGIILAMILVEYLAIGKVI